MSKTQWYVDRRSTSRNDRMLHPAGHNTYHNIDNYKKNDNNNNNNTFNNRNNSSNILNYSNNTGRKNFGNKNVEGVEKVVRGELLDKIECCHQNIQHILQLMADNVKTYKNDIETDPKEWRRMNVAFGKETSKLEVKLDEQKRVRDKLTDQGIEKDTSHLYKSLVCNLTALKYGSLDDIASKKESNSLRCLDSRFDSNRLPSDCSPSNQSQVDGPLKFLKNTSLNLSFLPGKKSNSDFDLSPREEKLAFDLFKHDRTNNKETKKNTIFHITTDMYPHGNDNLNCVTSMRGLVEGMRWRGLWLDVEECRLKFEEKRLELRGLEFGLEGIARAKELLQVEVRRRRCLEDKLLHKMGEQLSDVKSLREDLLCMEDDVHGMVEEKSRLVEAALTDCHLKLLKIEHQTLIQQPISNQSHYNFPHDIFHSSNQALQIFTPIFVFIFISMCTFCGLFSKNQ